MLKFIYAFFLGLLLVIFVGMGVASFYPSPEPPKYPTSLEYSKAPEEALTKEQQKQEREYRALSEAYDSKMEVYNRNVSVIVLICAIVMLTVSLVFDSRIGILADGLLLGGVFTLIYSIGRSFASGDPKYSFVVVTIGLVITMGLGYLKFMKPQASTPKHK